MDGKCISPFAHCLQSVNETNLHKLDSSQTYIDLAVKSSIGVIDVNIPDRITITPDLNIDPNSIHVGQSVEYKSQSTDVARKEAEKLTEYIWENYIEPNDYPGGIWLIGAGHAFHCVAKLLAEHEGVVGRLNGVIGFICKNPLRPINSADSRLAAWYREKSRIFVSKDHDVWKRPDDKDGKKKISKRYGKIIKSDETILNSLMQRHLPEVVEFLKETGKWDMGDGYDEIEEEGVVTGIGMLSSPPTGTGLGQGGAAGPGSRSGSRPVTAVSQPATPPQRT